MKKGNILMVAAAILAGMNSNQLAQAQTSSGSDKSELLKVADALAAVKCASAKVEYEVMLPSSAEPVTYTLTLEENSANADRYAPCEYMVEWRLPRPKGESVGFAAYGKGSHYRYRDLKLQEYHAAEDSVPFHIGRGVQNQGQFVELLPPYLSERFREMATDSAYTVTVRKKDGSVSVSGRQQIKGYDALEFDYTLDSARGMLPTAMSLVYNPASISEQTVDAKFEWAAEAACLDVNEQMLMERHPEVFEKFRTSNFRVESLVGQALPEFAAQTAGGERYIHHHGEAMSQPTAIVFLDPKVESAAETVAAVRSARMESPQEFDIVYAYASNPGDAREGITGGVREGETVLVNARSLVRDCGVNAFPTIIFCDSDGVVRDLQTAYNKELPMIVIQKMMLCN